MELNWVTAGIAIGLVLIVGLAAIIWVTWRDLKKLKAAQAKHQAEQQQELDKHRRYLVESMQVIAKTMLDDQLELSEGCIRIKVLLDNYDADLHRLDKFRVFNLMYQGLSHMPTHEARKQTDSKLIRKLDAERFKLEREHRDAIRHSAQQLLAHFDGANLH